MQATGFKYDPVNLGGIVLTPTDVKIEAKESKTKRTTFIVIDCSGSMKDSPLEQAKRASRDLATACGKYGTVHIICFNDEAKVISTLALDQLVADGYTNFTEAIVLMTSMLTPNMGACDVVFLTDGLESNDGRGTKNPYLPNRIADFKTTAVKCASSLTVHAFGFGNEPDAVFLNRLVQTGNVVGSFTHVRNSQEITPAIAQVTSTLVATTRVATVTLTYANGRTVVERVPLVTDEEGTRGVLICALDEKATMPTVTYEGKQLQVTMDSTTQEYTVHFLNGLQTWLANIITELVTANANRGADYERTINTLNRRVDDLNRQLTGLTPLFVKDRTTYSENMTYYLKIKEIVSQFKAAYAQAALGQLTNTNVIKLNDLAFQGLSGRSKRNLDELTARNIQFYKRNDHNLAEYLKGLDEKVIEEKYAEDDAKFGECILCTEAPSALVKRGSPLCVCVTIFRPASQASMIDASCLAVREIHPTLVCQECFAQNVIYVLEGKDGVPTFGKESDKVSLFQGTAREKNINACLPLYIGEEHWRIVELSSPPLLAWNATTNPLAYAPDRRVLYYMGLQRCMELKMGQPSERNQLMFDSFLQASRQVMAKSIEFETRRSEQEAKDKADGKEVKERQPSLSLAAPISLKDYGETPLLRLKDHLPNNRVYLAQLVTQKVQADALTPFLSRLMEEEMRRQTLPKIDLCAVLDIDLKQHVDAYVSDYEKTMAIQYSKSNLDMQGYVDLFNERLAQMGIILPTEAKGGNGDEKTVLRPITHGLGFDPQVTKLCSAGEELVGRVNHIFKTNVRPLLLQVVHYCSSKDKLPLPGEEDQKLELATLGLNSHEKMLAFIIQTASHGDNADRRHALGSKGHEVTYLDPFDEKSAKEYLIRVRDRYIVDQRSSRCDPIRNRYTQQRGSNLSSLFGQAQTLHEAAAVFNGAYIGVNVSNFARVLQNNSCPLAFEKIRLMLEGSITIDGHRVTLYADADHWKPSRQNCHKFYAQNRDKASRDAWRVLFVECDHALSSW